MDGNEWFKKQKWVDTFGGIKLLYVTNIAITGKGRKLTTSLVLLFKRISSAVAM